MAVSITEEGVKKITQEMLPKKDGGVKTGSTETSKLWIRNWFFQP